jgi:hypothetical protein
MALSKLYGTNCSHFYDVFAGEQVTHTCLGQRIRKMSMVQGNRRAKKSRKYSQKEEV